ncbi:hypothetical protein CAP31_07850 [Sulfuriferula sp. AH1]|uniref:hypothetical protein n=1 Tax=Sulfuriferula sp. AH1 TaxID=1985873 RepID=UPI000B3BABF8|nr:hypothetical protein [Sulfuriferula sp. AH1]ARU31604.1 hypothetical protein CAP31_07850 [Sulfuriferula sp. AH1]
MKTLFSLILLSTLAACSGGPTVPDWKIDTQTGIARYTQYYLEGRSKLAEASFAKSRAATAATGDIAAVAHLELVKCGVQTAAVDPSPCQAYTALAANATSAQDAAYYRFISGDWQGLNSADLPAQYAPLVNKSTADDINPLLQHINDPLSRLVASGVAVKRNQFNLKTLQIAADTAAAQGWRRPLLAYLLLEEKNTTESAQLQQIRTRIEIIESSLH